jgi:exonuclease 3'-5' domain-containing protein 1
MELHHWIKTKKDAKALMAHDVFASRPLSDKAMQYCANDVLYLPAMRNMYAQKISSQWMKKVIDESARRVVDACDPEYQPQSETKKLGPWGSGLEEKTLSVEEWIEIRDDMRMDAYQRDLLGYDDDDEYHEGEDCPLNSKDAAWDDTFESCWDS